MHLGIDARELAAGVPTGIATYTRNLLIEWRRQKPQWGITLYSDRPISVLPVADLNCRMLSRAASVPYWDQVLLPEALRHDRVDVFFSPYIKIPLRAPCPTISTIHDVLFFMLAERYAALKPALENMYYLAFIGLVLQRASAITTVSACTRRDLLRIYGSKAERVQVVYPGAAPASNPLGRLNRDALREKWAQGNLLYVGNAKAHKNLSTLCKAYGLLPAETQAAHPLVIVGDVEGADAFSAWLRDQPYQLRVVQRGRLSDEALEREYQNAALVVTASRYEGFGLPVIEAYRRGIPVVCSHTSALGEIGALAALLADPRSARSFAHALQKVLSDFETWNAMREKGLLAVRSFSWSTTAHKLAEVIDRLAKTKRSL